MTTSHHDNLILNGVVMNKNILLILALISNFAQAMIWNYQPANDHPIHHAIHRSSLAEVETALDADPACLEVQNSLGMTPLIHAIESCQCDPRIVDLLIRRRSNLAAVYPSQNPFLPGDVSVAQCAARSSEAAILQSVFEVLPYANNALSERVKFIENMANNIRAHNPTGLWECRVSTRWIMDHDNHHNDILIKDLDRLRAMISLIVNAPKNTKLPRRVVCDEMAISQLPAPFLECFGRRVEEEVFNSCVLACNERVVRSFFPPFLRTCDSGLARCPRPVIELINDYYYQRVLLHPDPDQDSRCEAIIDVIGNMLSVDNPVPEKIICSICTIICHYHGEGI
ncbi:MAG: hypothetical protein ACREGC_01615 [Minisyncoccia bacterium]